MTRRTFPRTLALLVVLAALATSGGAAWGAGAAVPGAVLAKLRGDIRTAKAGYAKVQPALVAAARAQRAAQAAASRAQERGELAATLAAPIAAFVGTDPAAAFNAHAQELAGQAGASGDALDAVTERAAEAQGRVLDAERRLAAIQRATSSEARGDAGLGSHRFGSGGPAVSAESIDRYLASKGSPIAGNGRAFLKAGLEHDVDPRLLVAIAGAESYFGAETCASFNAWGWGCPTSPYRFASWAEAIDTVARGLREGYLDHGLTTIGRIHLRYAPPAAKNDPTGLNYAWPDNVARFLVEQGGDPQSVAGVLRPTR